MKQWFQFLSKITWYFSDPYKINFVFDVSEDINKKMFRCYDLDILRILSPSQKYQHQTLNQSYI